MTDEMRVEKPIADTDIKADETFVPWDPALRIVGPNRRARLLIRLSVTLATLVFFAYGLVPDERSAWANYLRSTDGADALLPVQKRAVMTGLTVQSTFTFPAGLLANVVATADVGAGGAVLTHTSTIYRPDRLIIFGGLFGVLLLIAWIVTSSNRGTERMGLGIEWSRLEEGPSQKTAVELFGLEVEAAERRAELLFSRSTLLLGAGIIMAFIGVAVFYVTLPEATKEDHYPDYFTHAIRPTGVLIFVEAIAWFLLRQYRALIEDYKWFHRLYLKRANYLAAIRLLEKTVVRPEDVFVAVSLIREDLSGRLQKGETTEGLEALRQGEDDPIGQILKTMASFRGGAAKHGQAAKDDKK